MNIKTKLTISFVMYLVLAIPVALDIVTDSFSIFYLWFVQSVLFFIDSYLFKKNNNKRMFISSVISGILTLLVPIYILN